MKCPKCGYHGFDHLDHCKKCGQDLLEHKLKFNLRSFFSPAQITEEGTGSLVEETVAPIEDNAPGSDFGFDFLDDEEQPAETDLNTEPESFELEIDQTDLNIARPFGIDGESVPAEKPLNQKAKDL